MLLLLPLLSQENKKNIPNELKIKYKNFVFETMFYLVNELTLQNLKNEDHLTMLYKILDIGNKSNATNESQQRLYHIKECMRELVFIGKKLTQCCWKSKFRVPNCVFDPIPDLSHLPTFGSV